MATQIPIALMGESDRVLARYRQLVGNGESPRMAEILATRHFPGTHTDTMRLVDVPTIGQLQGIQGKYYTDKLRSEAAKAGITLGGNSRYNGHMADTRGGGDPKAWLHAGDGISTYKQRIIDCGGEFKEMGVEMDVARVAEREAKKRVPYDAKESRRKEKIERLKERVEKAG